MPLNRSRGINDNITHALLPGPLLLTIYTG